MSHYDPHVPGQYPTPSPAARPPKRKTPLWVKILVGILAVPTVIMGGCTAIVAGSGIAQHAAGDPTPVISTQTPVAAPTTDAPVVVDTPEAPQPPKPVEKAPTRRPMTASQEQAVGSAQSYLEVMPFSRAGLIHQLSSADGEGFSKADATYAVDHITVDWNEQAARSARQYLQVSHFSRAGLVHQLESEAGEGFTHSQAVYGAKAAGL